MNDLGDLLAYLEAAVAAGRMDFAWTLIGEIERLAGAWPERREEIATRLIAVWGELPAGWGERRLMT